MSPPMMAHAVFPGGLGQAVGQFQGQARVPLRGPAQGEQGLAGLAAHGGDVAQVDGQGLPAQLRQGGVGQVEVDALHQRVHGPEEIIGPVQAKAAQSSPIPKTTPGGGGPNLRLRASIRAVSRLGAGSSRMHGAFP